VHHVEAGGDVVVLVHDVERLDLAGPVGDEVVLADVLAERVLALGREVVAPDERLVEFAGGVDALDGLLVGEAGEVVGGPRTRRPGPGLRAVPGSLPSTAS